MKNRKKIIVNNMSEICIKPSELKSIGIEIPLDANDDEVGVIMKQHNKEVGQNDSGTLSICREEGSPHHIIMLFCVRSCFSEEDLETMDCNRYHILGTDCVLD